MNFSVVRLKRKDQVQTLTDVTDTARTGFCVKYGLSCVTACKNCNGEAGENVQGTAMHDVVGVEEAEVDPLDSAADDIADDEDIKYYMPWKRKL